MEHMRYCQQGSKLPGNSAWGLKPIMGLWQLCPQRGPWAGPREAESILAFRYAKERQICPHFILKLVNCSNIIGAKH